MLQTSITLIKLNHLIKSLNLPKKDLNFITIYPPLGWAGVIKSECRNNMKNKINTNN